MIASKRSRRKSRASPAVFADLEGTEKVLAFDHLFDNTVNDGHDFRLAKLKTKCY
jgi:hypothetical protein